MAVTTAVFVFILLSTGTDSLFQPAEVEQEDWLVVNRAYFGALIMALLLCALGTIALRTQFAFGAVGLDTWPRFQLLEGKEGPRDRIIARFCFFALLIVPAVTLYASLRAYLRKSVVCAYDSLATFGDDFWGSRIGALSITCDNRPCFRFYPHDKSYEWFWFSDFGLSLALGGAMATWGFYTVRVIHGLRTENKPKETKHK